MLHIASFISHPDAPVLEDAPMAHIASELPRGGSVKWLRPATAVEIPFVARGGEIADAVAIARDFTAGLPVDVNVFPAGGTRRKGLLVADMDSTMIAQECVDELADLKGLRAEIAAITERAMRGEIAFEPALRERVALLRGIPVQEIERLIRTRITLMGGAEALVRTMRAHGAHTALVSGGFTVFTGPIASRIGFDEQRGNHLDIVDGAIVGTVAEPILGAAAKRSALIELRERLGLAPADTMAVGDGANDLKMLEETPYGVAFHAKPAVAHAASLRIDHGDLTALLYLQGYREAEFVA